MENYNDFRMYKSLRCKRATKGHIVRVTSGPSLTGTFAEITDRCATGLDNPSRDSPRFGTKCPLRNVMKLSSYNNNNILIRLRV